MSYKKKQIKSKIHRIKPKISILKNIWFWILTSSFLVIIIFLYFLFFYPDLQLKNVTVSGNEKIKTEEIQSFVFDATNIKIINFLSIKIDSNSIFLINKNKINKNILEKFPAIEKITITRNFPQTLNINITEKKPVGIYCYFLEVDQIDKCFSIDENGIIFEPLEEVDYNTTIVRQMINNKQINVGQEAISRDVMNMLYKIKKTLQDDFQVDLREAVVNSYTKLSITTNEGWKIYFDIGTGSDIDSQITKLDLLLKDGFSNTAEGNTRNNLKYIDLVPRDRAIVCDNNICSE
jgi:cell division protein FtsQ